MTTRLIGIVAALAVVALVAVGAVVLASGDGAYAFKVNHSEVSQESLNEDLSVLHDNEVVASSLVGEQLAPFGEGSVPQNVTAGWLQIRIISEFARQDLARRDERVTADDRDSVGLPDDPTFDALPSGFRASLVESIASVRALQRVVANDPEVAGLIEAGCPSQRYVSHILVETAEEVAAVQAQLAAGADFATLAQTASIDGSAQDGGQLGCLDASQFVEPFATAAQTQPIGVVSAPVQTEFGFHLVLVTDEANAADIDAASLAAVLDAARRSDVEIDPRYGSWDARNGQVVPPGTDTSTG